MTGAQHYLAAEKLLSRALFVRGPEDFSPRNPTEAAHCLAAAQVHAALALAAATALNEADGGMVRDDSEEWLAAASTLGDQS